MARVKRNEQGLTDAQAKAVTEELERRKAQADAESKAKEATKLIMLTADETAKADEFGAQIGGLALYKTGSAEALRQASLLMLTFHTEGDVNVVNGKQDLMLTAIMRSAWHATGATGEPKISTNSTLNNAASGLRKICRGFSLNGHIERDGKPIDTIAGLTGTLNRAKDAKGGFYPAVTLAKEYEKLAKERAHSDPEFAELAHVDINAVKRGKEKGAPSDVRMAGILGDVPVLTMAQTRRACDALVQRLLGLTPVSDQPPARKAINEARVFISGEGKAFIAKAFELIDKANAAMVQPANPGTDVTVGKALDQMTKARDKAAKNKNPNMMQDELQKKAA